MIRSKSILGFLSVLVFIFMCSASALAQTAPADLSGIRVDELSDSQIRQFRDQVQSMGLKDAQLEQVATARGMRPAEVQKLRARVNRLNSQGSQNKGSASDSTEIRRQLSIQRGGLQDSLSRRDSLSLAEQLLFSLRSKIYGAELFTTSGLTFEPNLRLATPQNYQIGPDDELMIDIYGFSEASYSLKVTPDGNINIPYVGVISLSGLTIEQSTARIKSRLSSIYPGIRSGTTFVNVSIGNIRSIKVVLTGEVVKPGTYTLPSVSTSFNALYSSGGPTENGSFRAIEVIRGGRKIATMDVYDFLLNGQLKNDIRLQDQDVIRIPTYKKRVEIVGEVKRPGIFEMLEGENLADLIRFSGDFTERAYKARIKVLKNTAIERKISDVTSSDYTSYAPSSGDKYFVDEILNRFENRVTIEGAVFRPGEYELVPGLTLRQLLTKAEGLREDAFLNRAYITRLGNDLQREVVSIDINEVLNSVAGDIVLKREDYVTIASIFDIQEEYSIRVEGEVRAPGKLAYGQGMTLEDAILRAGGFKEGATSQRIEVSRRVRNSDALSATAVSAQVFQINVDQDLKTASSKFILQPFDIIAVRPSTSYEVQKMVTVEGEVLYPGLYTIVKKNERVSDLIKRAGGFTALAYAEGASLKRPGSPGDSTALRQERLKQMRRLQNDASDSTSVNNGNIDDIRNDYVGIDMTQILEKPGSGADIFLEEGDILKIPRQLQTVKVRGEVLSPVTVIFSPNRSFKRYVSNAGGFSERALKRKAYVIYANGAVKSTNKILFFNNYPTLKAGAEIFVPQKNIRKTSLAEIVGLSTGLASLAALVLSILR